MRFASILPLLVGALGCQVDEPRDCTDDRCEMAGSREELLAALEGHADPVADYLRAAATDRGTLVGDYRMVLDGVGGELGCDASTEKSFVVLSNQNFAPKPIVTRCSSDAQAGSKFFMAMIATDSGIDPKTVHLAAWDEAAGTYRRYATAPTADGEMAINVSPQFCLGCHAGPEKIGTWVPIMNEMSSPWANWNATPGFASELFDEHLDPVYASDATYRDVTAPGKLASAASFEPLVRAGVSKVTASRLLQRTSGPDVQLALELLRPLYCDESVNYVSEVHTSGELRTHALVDDAIRSLYRSADVDGAWTWLADSKLQLPPPTTGEQPVTLIPVRSEATLQVELGLVARGVLSPGDVLRVRALDWKHPVGSPFRCDLYRQGATRIASGALDAAIAGSGATTTADLIPYLFDEIMKLDGVPLVPPPSGEVLQLADATDPQALSAFEAGQWDGFAATLAQLGDLLEAHVGQYRTSGMRTQLAAERNRRACAVAADPTAPIYDVSCP